ncbi:MAG: hypothetical protein JW730_18325 [Anaerolineales bacterium]|nr:hypothetical protein [Anaerolineales bacterium]
MIIWPEDTADQSHRNHELVHQAHYWHARNWRRFLSITAIMFGLCGLVLLAYEVFTWAIK